LPFVVEFFIGREMQDQVELPGVLAGPVGADSRLGGPVREGTESVRGRGNGVEPSPGWTVEEGSRA
jgi:hypothetical protein